MKDTFTQTYATRASKLRPRRVRLTPARTPRRLGRSAARPAISPPPRAPLLISREIDSTEPIRDTTPRGDALQLYLREIGQVKLLTPKEEIELAQRIKRGDNEAREHMIKA